MQIFISVTVFSNKSEIIVLKYLQRFALEMSDSNQLTFVFEVCENCSSHQWNTRHDEAKYDGMFNDISATIKEFAPNARCIKN